MMYRLLSLMLRLMLLMLLMLLTLVILGLDMLRLSLLDGVVLVLRLLLLDRLVRILMLDMWLLDRLGVLRMLLMLRLMLTRKTMLNILEFLVLLVRAWLMTGLGSWLARRKLTRSQHGRRRSRPRALPRLHAIHRRRQVHRARVRCDRIQRAIVGHRHIAHLHSHVRILELLRLADVFSRHHLGESGVGKAGSGRHAHGGGWRELPHVGLGGVVLAIQGIRHVGRRPHLGGELLLRRGMTRLLGMLLLRVLLALLVEVPVAHHDVVRALLSRVAEDELDAARQRVGEGRR